MNCRNGRPVIERLENRALLAATAGVAFGGVFELADVTPLGVDRDVAGHGYVAGAFTGRAVDFGPRRGDHPLRTEGDDTRTYQEWLTI